ncbi:uncharacterized protein LOC127264864 [Andrographis paniculata]|uniref:uncharacterized protein LOC127264864 n=1 Tax=Andrographis paniculata TaxID=175694 RepID=UPI0021E769FF|nr:uncharacterized protein LOC127264864 [Andrographis paniculata]
MATTVFRTPPSVGAPAAYLCSDVGGFYSRKLPRGGCFECDRLSVLRCRVYGDRCWRSVIKMSTRPAPKFFTFAADGEAMETKDETLVKVRVEGSETESEPEFEWNIDEAVEVDASSESDDTVVDENTSSTIAYLNLLKEALASKDEAKVTEVESLLKSLEDEKIDLEKRRIALSEELSYAKVLVIRISSEFDSFRKRMEREQLSVVSNAGGEVVETLLPILDSFERVKAEIKVQTEGEEKINNSYLSINKQFVEILASLNDVPVETEEKPYDPTGGVRFGSGFSQAINKLVEKLHKVCSHAMKTWIRI